MLTIRICITFPTPLSIALLLFAALHFRRHRTSPYPFASALLFQRCFRPRYCFSPHCNLGDTERHHTHPHYSSSAAFHRIIAFNRISTSETQHVASRYPLALAFALSSAAFDALLLFHRIAFPRRHRTSMHQRSDNPICFLFLFSCAAFCYIVFKRMVLDGLLVTSF